MKKKHLLKLINIWPPYLGAGIRVHKISSDLRVIEVEMKLRFWNRNYVGTHFGGSLYSMVDPFLMLMLIENLGPDYVVWDKAANIRFRKPGRGRVSSRFTLSQQEIDSIKRQVDAHGKAEPRFTVLIINDQGETIAEIEKILSVKKKNYQQDSGKN